VFALAFLFLLAFADTRPLGAGSVDPLSGTTAQDEALYSHTAVEMARGGSWLTPEFLHRPALYSPPFLYWVSAMGSWIGGQPLGLRLPSIVAAAGTVTIVFRLALGFYGVFAAATCALLVLGSNLFYTLARLNLADSLLTFFFVACAALLISDARFERGRTAVVYGLLMALAILTKGMAGLLPGMLLAGWLIVSRQLPFGRLSVLLSMVFALAAPWHLYQLTVNTRWFWKEYVALELLRYGFGGLPQDSGESTAAFYAVRLWRFDPFLLALAAAGGVVWARNHERLRGLGRLLAVWMVVLVSACFGYRYRNANYLMPLFPALALTAAPLFQRWRWAPAAAAALLLMKLAVSTERVWGITPTMGELDREPRAIKEYAMLDRPNSLVLMFANDNFHAATLDLPRIHYGYFAPAETLGPHLFPFHEMGIAMIVPDFLDRANWRAKFGAKLAAWGWNDDRCLATAILVRTREEAAELIRRSPDVDFYVPLDWIPKDHGHDEIYATVDRRWLLARSTASLMRDGSAVPRLNPGPEPSGSPRLRTAWRVARPRAAGVRGRVRR
jgi:hypothetical protein